MSLTSALSSAVAGLKAQSLALSAISENIANSSTTAYKVRDTTFSQMLTGALSTSMAVSGVTARTSQAMLTQGLISTSTNNTNLAIDGSGFFIVSDSTTSRSSEYVYSRNGSFTTNADGYLVNSDGYILLGYETDARGNIISTNNNDLSGLEAISLQSINGTAQATTKVAMTANLPADAAPGDSFTSTIELIDAVGVSHTVQQTWTKTATNSWTLDLAAPYATDNPGAASGNVTPSTFAIAFDGNGVLNGISPSPSFTLSGLDSGANATTIALDLGTIGATNGLTQFAASSGMRDIEITNIDQDGARYGQLSSISISDTGLVTASFDNGISRAIYRIPLATFTNPGGLQQVSGSVYRASVNAGTLNITTPGDGAAGTISAGALEGSATDTASEFNKMIVAQQAYSASAQIISTVDEMYSSLLQAIR